MTQALPLPARRRELVAVLLGGIILVALALRLPRFLDAQVVLTEGTTCEGKASLAACIRRRIE